MFFLFFLFFWGGGVYTAAVLRLSPELQHLHGWWDIFILLLGHVRVFLLKFKHAALVVVSSLYKRMFTRNIVTSLMVSIAVDWSLFPCNIK